MQTSPVNAPDAAEPFRLHIGGIHPKAGWKILNVQPGEHVDYIGTCSDLSRFADGSVAEIYASHVYEHLGYQEELPTALREAHRVLKPEGLLLISVPNLEVLCQLFLHQSLNGEQRFHIMRMMFGGQMDQHDFHKVGLTFEFIQHFAGVTGFRELRRLEKFDLFPDTSGLQFGGVLISLNVELTK
ncbi:MAG: methyltransferase domain-containing protein [Planctomycetes bacterium]|nr:methyltransferase domain-containing protein [Planctomycetota bacterium]